MGIFAGKGTKWFGTLTLIGIGTLVGGTGYLFTYAKGYSYLSNDPNACVNCHIMRDQFVGWSHSVHKSAATCNDCHTPNEVIGKWTNKASNGFWHAYAFTTGEYADPIRIRDVNRKIAMNSCRKCHSNLIDSHPTLGQEDSVSCTHCHKGVGH